MNKSNSVSEQVRRKLSEQIELHEGYERYPYKDHLGNWTVGIGELLQPCVDRLIHLLTDGNSSLERTSSEIRVLLAGLRSAWDGVPEVEARGYVIGLVDSSDAWLARRCEWYATLSDIRKACVIEMTFQLGRVRVLRFSKMIAAIEKSDYTLAAAEMLSSNWAQQTPKRAKKLSEQMRTGEWQT